MRPTLATQLAATPPPLVVAEGPTRLHMGVVRQWLCTRCLQWVSFRTMPGPRKTGGFRCSMCLGRG